MSDSCIVHPGGIRTDRSHHVTCVPIDRIGAIALEIRTEGDRAGAGGHARGRETNVLKGELHIQRRATTGIIEMPVTLRKQRVVVERIDPDKSTGEEQQQA